MTYYPATPVSHPRAPMDLPEGFEIDTDGPYLALRCSFCHWHGTHNRNDEDRFWHSMKVHAWNFCPSREPGRQ